MGRQRRTRALKSSVSIDVGVRYTADEQLGRMLWRVGKRRLCMRRDAGSLRTNLRYSRRYAASDDRLSVSVETRFISNVPVRRRSTLEDERISSDSGDGNFWIFSIGSSSTASFSSWVISAARERPSAVDLRSGEDQHRVGMRARKVV
jgi:hypothetical protein